MDVEFSSHFIKRAKKLSSSEKRILSQKVEWFRKNPHDSRLKTHALTGKLEGLYSFSLSFSKRAIFVYSKSNRTLFIDVGSHGEVYR